jgi:aryl-alcohol dehydrogenase-like predicted oxidoreductase
MPNLTSADGSPASQFCFGTMQFGGGSTEAESAACYNASREAGINFFDCAWAYAGGKSEKILGKLAANEREQLIITSKGGHGGGTGRANLQSQLDDSLRRLNMDYLDIYFLHRIDTETPLENVMETVAGFVDAGKAKKIGVSNYSAWQVMKAQCIAKSLGIRIDIVQPMYNLVKRQAEVEILPMCASEDIAVTPYSPLGGGLLTGKYDSTTASGRITQNEEYSARYSPEWMFQTARDLSKLAAEINVSPITLAVQWVKANANVTAPIISGRTPEQLAPSLAALDADLSDTLYNKITKLSPTPPPATDRLEEG